MAIAVGSDLAGYSGKRSTQDRHAVARAALCGRLGWCEVASDDELDAIICAATAAVAFDGALAGAALEMTIRNRVPACADCRPPKGYILLQQPPPTFTEVSQADFATWIGERQ